MTLQAAPPEASLSMAKAALTALPLRFEANQGQWKPEVRFAARTGGVFVAMTDRGPSLSFSSAGKLDLTLVGSSASASLEPLEPLAAHTDYYTGSRDQWHTGVANYSRVRYQGVYRGIDVVYYGNHNQLEYDFVVQPGADPRAIRLAFQGAQQLRITGEGDLLVQTASGSLTEKRPVILQDGKAIAGRYKLLGRNQVGFQVGSYDRTRPLVIDPVVLLYSTYIGGSGVDQVNAVKLDSNGRIYIAGQTDGSGIPYIDGAYSNTNNLNGTIDTFLTILDSSYHVVYTSYIGGVGNDIPLGLAVDSNGNAYIAGSTTSSNFPMAGSSFQSTGATSALYGFALKLNPASYGGDSLVYSTYLGGALGTTSANAIDVDSTGNMYIIGTTRSSDFPVTTSAYAGVMWGLQDMFLVKLTTESSSALYSTFLGGELAEDGRAIAVAPNGLVYFGASTNSQNFPLQGPVYRATLAGTGGRLDMILGAIDTNKFGLDSLIYCTYFGGSDNDEVRGIALDAQGNLLVTGYTLSGDFPTTPDAAQRAYGGNSDAFVLSVNINKPGLLVYSSFLGGTDGEVGYAIGADSTGAIYTTGYTLSDNFPTQDAPQGNYVGGVEVFVSKLKPGAAGRSGIIYSTYFGDATVNFPQSMAVTSDGRVFIGGAAGSNWPTTEGSLQGFNGGLSDGFVLVLK